MEWEKVLGMVLCRNIWNKDNNERDVNNRRLRDWGMGNRLKNRSINTSYIIIRSYLKKKVLMGMLLLINVVNYKSC